MCKIVDLTGQVFDRLTVIERSKEKSSEGKPLWDCECSCGNMTTAKTIDLRSHKKKSCGCLRFDCNTNYKHGQGSPKTKSREYRIWQGMVQRIRNKNQPAYRLYGGRGIKLEKKWYSFINFFNDMGKCPSHKYSLDRINPDGDYRKSNCRWSTSSEQNRNRRNNHWIEFEGRKMILKDWACELHTTPTNIISMIKTGKKFSDIHNFYMVKHEKLGVAIDYYQGA